MKCRLTQKNVVVAELDSALNGWMDAVPEYRKRRERLLTSRGNGEWLTAARLNSSMGPTHGRPLPSLSGHPAHRLLLRSDNDPPTVHPTVTVVKASLAALPPIARDLRQRSAVDEPHTRRVHRADGPGDGGDGRVHLRLGVDDQHLGSEEEWTERGRVDAGGGRAQVFEVFEEMGNNVGIADYSDVGNRLSYWNFT